MKVFEYLFGWLLLAAMAVGVYYVFQVETAESVEGEETSAVAEVPVHIGKLQQLDMHRYVKVYGRVDSALPSCRRATAAEVTAAVEGVIGEIDPDVCSLGQVVNKGTILFRLDSRIADNRLSQAKQREQFAQKAYDRQKELMKAQATSEKALQEAYVDMLEAQKTLQEDQLVREYMDITSPLSGRINRIYVTSGQKVSAGQPLAEICDDSQLFVTALVPVEQSMKLLVGMKSRIYIPTDSTGQKALNLVQLDGNVVYIEPEVMPATDSVRVQIRPNGDVPEEWLKGRLVRVEIEQDVHRKCLAADIQAVVRDENERTYLAILDGKTARRRYVTTGIREGGYIEVSGQDLTAGMVIVTQGAYGLLENTQVRILDK